MRVKLKNFINWVKRKFPEYRLRTEYTDMIRKLKRLENQVEDNAKQLELAKSSFLKNLYHEIRTPLNAIVGFTNIIARDNQMATGDKEEYLNLINQSSTDFLRLMDDIIQASLLEAGMVNINRDEFELHEFLDDLHIHFNTRKHTLKKTNIALLKNIPNQNNELEIVSDRQRLYQILSHLVENALKFTDKGVIEYGYCIKDKKLEFYVKDSGTSDLEGKNEFLFSKFSKIDISESAKNGLGLGLSISKELVELLGGKIWYEINRTKGTSFYFQIPFVTAEAESVSKENQKKYFHKSIKGHNHLAV